MTIKNFKNIFFYGIAIGVSIFLLFFIILGVWIGYDVKSQCQSAERQYSNSLPAGSPDCVDALLMRLRDEKNSYRSKNEAIWALGQLGGARALPTLQEYYTGNIPDREPLDKVISQYELRKAIELAKGGPNITAIFWRYNVH